MKVLITGGEGFIARNLAERLAGAHELAVAGRRELDLLDESGVFETLDRGRFDAVLHTANYDAAPRHSAKDPAKVLENNLRMFFHLFRGRHLFGRMLYFGSGAEFGRDHWGPAMKEDAFGRHVPTDPYGLSKFVMTQAARSCDNVFNLRLFGVFGRYEDWRTRFIASACASAVSGRPIRIAQDRAFDFLSVEDLAAIVERFLHEPPPRADVNVCTGRTVDLTSIAGTIRRLAGAHVPVEVRTGGRGRDYGGDNTLLLAALKSYTFRPLEESLRDLVAWYDARRADLQEDHG